ncbi:ubiquitin-specific protease ubp2 [Irineochytrium annulatum]|nr:ubiquitin-specific protease ubp2 [Irineochytrium annulatum]
MRIGLEEGNTSWEDLVVADPSLAAGVPPRDAVLRAYDKFGIKEDEAVPDEMLISMATAGENVADLREALGIIGASRSSTMIAIYLETGQILSSDPVDVDAMMITAADLSIPCGLNNIGNTCYLNSLLQLYHTIVPLRKSVVDCKEEFDRQLSAVPEGEKDKLKAEHFASLLAQLFSDLEASQSAAISPHRELAEIALNSSAEERIFGLQQDVNECMDVILGLLESAYLKLNNAEARNVIKRVFFGTTKQTLHAKDLPTREKVEEFSNLILGVAPDLYTSLDRYFQTSQVESEGKIVDMRLSIATIPPVLIMPLRRVQYDLNINEPFKNNDFVRFHRTIQMDRFMSENAAAADERRTTFAALASRIAELKQREELLSSPAVEPTLAALLSLPDTGGDDGAYLETIGYLEALQREAEGGAEAVRGEIRAAEVELNNVYKDMDTKSYELHAVFGHQGVAQHGHYWIYIRDHAKKKWLKYNDSTVSEVPEDEGRGIK